MNAEISSIISKKNKYDIKDSLWVEKSLVITEFDTSILGEFARRIKEINGCFDVMYTYSRNPEEKKKITIIRDGEKENDCNRTTNASFTLLDSTKFFRISFDTLIFHKG